MKPRDLALASQRAYKHHTHEAGDSQATLEVTERGAILAFRGTEKDFGDILTDMRFAPWRSSKLRAWAHAGFLKSTQDIYPVLLGDTTAVVRAKIRLYITGHSLGAAQATLFASMLVASGVVKPDQISLTGFGSPPPQYGRGLNKWLKGVTKRLYRNGGDCVTRHPLLGSHVAEVKEIGPIADERNRFLDHRIAEYANNLKGIN